MGYATAFTLTVTKLSNPAQKPVTLDTILDKLERKKTVNKEEIKKDLLALKSGKAPEETPESIIANLRSINQDAEYAIDDNGDTSENCKWYSAEQDILAFSKQYPNWLFQLDGEGEESGDIWRKYFVDGKMQDAKARTVYDDFDASKLK